MTQPLTYERLAELQRLAKGQPLTPKPAPGNIAPAHTPPAADGRATPTGMVNVDHLLYQALRSENSRTRALAEKIHTLTADLAQRVQAEYQARRQRLDAEVTTLEQQLAEARAKLHSLDRDATPPTTPTPRTTAPTRQEGAKSGVDAAAVRAWAADNGYHVQPIGRIPTHIVTAWREATISHTTQTDTTRTP